MQLPGFFVVGGGKYGIMKKENDTYRRVRRQMNFDAFVADIKKNHWNVYGAEIYADGKLSHAYGDTTEHRYPIYSATKTITSVAVGMAADEGRLDIDKSVLEYLPEKILCKIPVNQQEVYRHITTKRLLTMSVMGYPFRPTAENWLEELFACPIPDVHKKEFDYSNFSAYLAGVVVSCAIKEDLYEYLNSKLFKPLGIPNPPAMRCPDGYFYGASGMELSVHELSKIGLMLYNGGVYEGMRIVSEEYVKEATSVQQMNREGGYGYFVWKYRNGFSINGKWGQKCFVLPKEEIMITYLGHMESGSDTAALRASMEQHILNI